MSEHTHATRNGGEEARCYCQLEGLIELISRKYAINVICAVGFMEPVRFGELEEAFERVSSSTLSARLEELTDADVLERHQFDEIPPRVEYHLTDTGEELCDLLIPLLEWLDQHCPEE